MNQREETLHRNRSLLVNRAGASEWSTIAPPVPYREEFIDQFAFAGPLRAKVYPAARVPHSLYQEVAELRAQVGSPADLRTDLHYLLGFGNSAKRRPLVVALHAGQTLRCVVVFRELMLGPVSLGIALVGDAVGDGDILCAASDRAPSLEAAIQALFRFRPSIHTVRLCMPATDSLHLPLMKSCAIHQERRPVKRHFMLAPTFAKQLSSFGKNTRRHLDGKRVRLEASGKIAFLPALSAQDAFGGMVTLSQVSGFFRAFQQHKNRFTMLATQPHAYCMGLKRDGEWLSLLSGWRDGNRTFVDLQMNNHLYEKESISAVMRSYMLEHEINHHQRDVVFVGGTSALLQRYCVDGEDCLDVLIRRRNLRCKSSELIVKRLAPEPLRQFLFSPESSPVEASCASLQAPRPEAAAPQMGSVAASS